MDYYNDKYESVFGSVLSPHAKEMLHNFRYSAVSFPNVAMSSILVDSDL